MKYLFSPQVHIVGLELAVVYPKVNHALPCFDLSAPLACARHPADAKQTGSIAKSCETFVLTVRSAVNISQVIKSVVRPVNTGVTK